MLLTYIIPTTLTIRKMWKIKNVELESRSKSTSVLSTENANLHSIILSDSQRSEINKEPIEDESNLYLNLSIRSSDIMLDSPCSSINIPSPFSFVNSPVPTIKNKRICEKQRGPGKIRTTNISEWKDVKRKALNNLRNKHTNRKGDIKEEKKRK